MSLLRTVAGVATGGLSLIGTGAALAPAIGNIMAAREQRRGQRRANERQRRIDAVQARQQRVGALRAQRRAAGQAFAQAGAMAGGGGTAASGVQGAVGALQTSTAANIGIAGQIDALRLQQSQILDRAARRAGRWSDFAQIAQAGQDMAGMAFGQ